MYKLSAWIITPVIGLMVLFACVFLPHDPYIRYQSLDIGTYEKAQWIYERLAFDETPVDVAFIGTSHTLNGIDSVVVEEALNTSGAGTHVTNLAIPHFGRDMHYVIGDLLLKHKQPKLLFIEIRELEARDLHPATHYLADTEDLLFAEMLVNLRYFDNLVRLPLRQLKLFAQTYVPELFNVESVFDSSKYKGSHVNLALTWADGRFRNKVIAKEKLNEHRVKENRIFESKQTQPGSFKDFAFYHANRAYLEQLVNKAKEKGVDVFFLYTPGYASTSKPYHEELYQPLAPIVYLNPADIFQSHTNWFDLGHLNAQGALAYSNRVSEFIFHYLSHPQEVEQLVNRQ